jgi:hypothetical protein
MTETAKQRKTEDTTSPADSDETREETQIIDQPLTNEKAVSLESDTTASSEIEGTVEGAGFDWLAMGLIILIAAFFSLTARFNSQPAPSYVPAAVLSATGCGLLVTALRKIRTLKGIGLLEAGLGGFCLALFQFAISLTYPGIFATLSSAPAEGHAFLLTWGLIGLFAVVMSLAGAALGHLAFAPLRPMPARKQRRADDEEQDEEEEQNETEEGETTETDVESEDEAQSSQDLVATGAHDEPEEAHDEAEEESEEEPEELQNAAAVTQTRSPLLNYVVTIILIGLLPIMIGYVFAAAYDYVMGLIQANQISPALYPTLSLLSGILPWRLAAPINLSSTNATFIIFTLLWRIPDSFLGNPQAFDVQALEPLLFNSAALAFFLILMYGREARDTTPKAAPWRIFLLLEALLGLLIIVPPDLWIHRGLEGVLQMQSLVLQLPSIQLLNPTMLTLNLVTAPVFCLLIGVIIRRQYQLWTQPRQKAQDPDPEEE